ncbi:MAG: hypothetical protein ACRDRY_04555 [Pseudonocardiaceae bacterium]
MSPTLWAMSTPDCEVHLLTQSEHPTDTLKARCGASLDLGVIQHDQPPPGPPCEPCRLIFLVEASAPGRFARRDE